MKTTKSKKVFSAIAVSTFLVFAGLLGGFVLSQENIPTSSPATVLTDPVAMTPTHDQLLVDYAQELGATNIKDVDLKVVDAYEGNDRVGEYNEAYAGDNMFDGSRPNKKLASITILNGRSVDDTKRTLAHEYLHHVWFSTLSESERIALGSDLKTTYGNDQFMKDRVASYSDSFSLQDTELFSFYCTESSDQFLTQMILEQCNKYIKRSALVMIR